MSTVVIPLHIAADHPAYAGHFPGHPILPGVVLLDCALHALESWALENWQGDAAGCGQIKSAKFHSPVTPGDALVLHASTAMGSEFRFEIVCLGADGAARKIASGVFTWTTGIPA